MCVYTVLVLGMCVCMCIIMCAGMYNYVHVVWRFILYINYAMQQGRGKGGGGGGGGQTS